MTDAYDRFHTRSHCTIWKERWFGNENISKFQNIDRKIFFPVKKKSPTSINGSYELQLQFENKNIDKVLYACLISALFTMGKAATHPTAGVTSWHVTDASVGTIDGPEGWMTGAKISLDDPTELFFFKKKLLVRLTIIHFVYIVPS